MFCGHAKAQETDQLFLLPGISQSSILNPAIQNKSEKLVIGVPFLSGANFSWNSNFPLDALFSNGLWNYSFHDFYNNLPPNGEVQASVRASMFYASMNIKNYSFNISLSDRAFTTASFDREVVRLIRDGIHPYFENDENFGSGTFDFNHFRELAFGVSQRYWKSLDIGIRPKILFGRTYYHAQDINFSVETITNENEQKELHLKPEGSFLMAAPVNYTVDSVFNYVLFSNDAIPADYSFNLRNLGMAIDFGVVYRPNEFYEFSASLLDLGFTGFRHNTYDVEFVDPIEFPTYELYQSYAPGDSVAIKYIEPREALRAFSDSVSYIISVQDLPVREVDLLPFKINLTGKYNFSESFSAGVSSQFSYYGRHSMNVLSGFAQKSFQRAEIGGNVSVYNTSAIWLGLAAGYTAEHVQYYISTKNIFGIILPANSKHINLSFGINFLFNTKRQ